VTFRIITADPTRVASLLSGETRAIENVPTSDLARIRANKELRLYRTVSVRLMYLHLDSARDKSPFVTDKAGAVLPNNPLKDVRVRKALSKAINRQAIVDRIMEGAAEPSGQFLPPGTYSYVPDLKPPPYEPSEAKKLLAEAGFPNGFETTLYGPNNRYVNDSKIIQAIGQMWTRAGVQTEVDPLPWTTYVARAGKQEFPAFLFGWGTATAEASDPLIAQTATWDPKKGWGASNRGRYSNPAMDAKLEQAMRTVDDRKREALLQEASRLVQADFGILPLQFELSVWAMRKDLTYKARADQATLAQFVKPTVATR